jgi:3-dehydroquinate dehydratase / shikimate dehydrogenase
MRRSALQAARAGADAVECRLDCLSHAPDAETVRSLFADCPLEAIATCRPPRQGGHFAGGEEERLAILHSAASGGAAFVDVESDVPPSAWPRCPVIVSHHDFQSCPPDLDEIVRRLEETPAAAIKVAFAAAGPRDAMRALDVLRSARKPAIALAMGEAGVISRALAKKFGAFGTYAALAPGQESAPGQPTIDEFTDLYGWRRVGPGAVVYGVVGHPVRHSLGPLVHNRAMAAAGEEAVYLPVLVEPGEECFRAFADALLQRPWLDWRGLSVTLPHKENALRLVGIDRCEGLARRIGAVNTITISPGGALRGDNTDCAAAIETLCQAMKIGRAALAGRRIAVLGAGGVARAIVAGLASAEADVTIYNRTLARAEALAEEAAGWEGPRRCRAAALDAIQHAQEEVLINCTSVGMHPNVEDCPVETIPPSVRVVFDTIYNPLQTRLLRLARDGGRLAVSGLEMFIQQAAAQFEIWTGKKAPTSLMRIVAMEKLARGR